MSTDIVATSQFTPSLVALSITFAWVRRLTIQATIQTVLAPGRVAHVVRVDAPPHPAEVVNLKTLWARSSGQFQCDSRGLSVKTPASVTVSDVGIAAGADLAQPCMAPSLRNRHREPVHHVGHRFSIVISTHVRHPAAALSAACPARQDHPEHPVPERGLPWHSWPATATTDQCRSG